MLFLDLETSCTSIELANLMKIVNNILTLISIVAPILLIIMLAVIFTQLVKDPDNKKLLSKLRNSIIALVVIFLIPVIVNAFFYALGEKYDVSSCWMLAKEHGYVISDPKYMAIEEEKYQSILTNPKDYEKGKPSTKATTIKGGITPELGRRLVAVGKTQLGVPYHSMHYGPKGSGHDGFGCAMFVSYCYNQVFFGGVSGQSPGLGGFYGSTYEYWGNVTRDGYNPHNKKFIEVSPQKAQAGDVVAFLRGGDHYSSYSNCYHVALYEGNGRIIHSAYSGVGEQSININNGDYHFLRYVGKQ